MVMDNYNPEAISKSAKLIICSVFAATAVGLFTCALNVHYHPKTYPSYSYTNTTSSVTNSGLEKAVE